MLHAIRLFVFIVLLALTAYAEEGETTPIGLWKCDDGGNILHDSSGNNNNGKVYDPRWFNGTKRYFLSIERKRYAEIQTTEKLRIREGFTIETWIKLDKRKSGGWRNIIGEYNGVDADNSASFIVREGTNQLSLGIWNINGFYGYCWFPHNITGDGLFHHFAAVYDGRNVRMYLDGILKYNRQMNAWKDRKEVKWDSKLRDGGGIYYLGRQTDMNHSFSVGGIRIYSRPIAVEETRKHYLEEIEDFSLTD